MITLLKFIPTHTLNKSTPQQVEYNLSDKCPHCQNSISPMAKFAIVKERLQEATINHVAILLQCPNTECSEFFIDWFRINTTIRSEISESYKEIYNFKHNLTNDLPNEVNEKFPEFNEIYSQALQAENYGLNLIAGVGYRKALEFLVKQYCIHKDPDNEEKIKKEALGATIANRLSDFPKIQLLAKAATWIGNDETHFVRKHKNHDITSMKKFIKSAATFISADLDADEAIEFTKKD
ncbi:hypothetical protein BFR41_02500 [Brochothrix thermosphacta]|nr:hypothetical protein BFR41_02500 [Brochothrix thermosphacta]ODJ72227.1 hypothetical protein BFR43_00665 [Brochothrix thermosphacta]